ncbi:MAG: nuclear transport factor 2 family protein [Actinomycetota bacterium]|nr:nuclear transport factor 2 family protein [Actinomycetota bacterium]
MYVTADHAIEADSAEGITRELADRQEVIDALLRFALGRDLRDRDLLLSAFTEDATFDFRPAAKKCGLEIPLIEPREMIAAVVLDPNVPLDTTHTVSNARVTFDGDTASLTALVEAQHLPAADHSRHAMLKNIYAVDLVRDGRRWVIRQMTVDNIWFTGDPNVIIGQ